MAIAFIISLAIPAIGTLPMQLPAKAQSVCCHTHETKCYSAPDGHECSIETGCEPVYQKTLTISSVGHTHEDDCYFTSGLPTAPEPNLACDLGEPPDVIEEETGTNAELTGWICIYMPELTCEHKDCAPDETCMLEPYELEQDELERNELGHGLVSGRDGLTGVIGLMSLEEEKFLLTVVKDGATSYHPTLSAAVSAANKSGVGDYIITAFGDDALDSVVNIATKYNITLKSSDGDKHTITQAAGKRHFTVSGSLILENIILEGLGSTAGTIYDGGVDVKGGGVLTVTTGAVIRGCFNSTGGGVIVASNGTFNMTGGQISGNTSFGASSASGGGIHSSGIIIITGGEISGNEAKVTTLNNASLYGAGVFSGGSFTMDGGTISGNKLIASDNVTTPNIYGGGVYINGGTFEMHSGHISGNTARNGGGVFVKSGTFNMTGGGIIDNMAVGAGAPSNRAPYGGGVHNSASFTMSGSAVIQGNWTMATNSTGMIASSGGGVYNAGTFTMNGGTICDNSVNGASADDRSYSGGGVTASSGTFTMNSGLISGNTAARGGGVSVGTAGTFNMNGGGIENNDAIGPGTGNFIIQGGGVHNAGIFKMSGDSEISGNNATGTHATLAVAASGGGVYNEKTFTMEGGTILGNSATAVSTGKKTLSGGGVAVTAGTLTMSGGTVSENTAFRGGGINVSGGTASLTGGLISNNIADEDGGGLFAEDFAKITGIGASVLFYGNKAGSAYWLGAFDDTASYNPGVNLSSAITVAGLKALHGPAANIKATSFSAAPDDNAKPFTYLANNYDLNFNGTGLKMFAPALKGVPNAIDYGTGALPTRKTLYGLYGGTPVNGSVNHVVNGNAQDAAALAFIVANPLLGDWSLELHCTTFTKSSSTGATPVAVCRQGAPVANAFYGNSSITMYDSAAFAADLALGLASIENGVGTWNWCRLLYDIKAEAEPGKQLADEYKSVFTWTLTIAP